MQNITLYKSTIYCDDFTCIHNDDGFRCTKDKITVNFTETEQFENGKRVSFNACRDYEDRGQQDGN